MDMLRRALEQARETIDRVTPEQAALPTPCRSWDVSALISHMVRDTAQFAEMARGAKWKPGELEVQPADWLASFSTGSDELLAAWESVGPQRGSVDQQVAEFAVHAWDLATATGQTAPLDPEVAEHALNWARGALKPEYRGNEESGMTFGPEVAISPDAAAPDRLAAFFGRSPA